MKFSLVFALLLLTFQGCNHKSNEAAPQHTSQQTLKTKIKAPVVTSIANLPDSQQPVKYFLDTMAPPLILHVPAAVIGSSPYAEVSGQRTTTSLQPPIENPLQCLEGKKGGIVRSATGQPFILGNGGISHFVNFNSDNGLAMDAVSCSLFDKKGHLWVGTFGAGLSRFDGKSFNTFTTAHGLGSNIIRCLFEDKKGCIWIGTEGGGLTKYDGESFKNFTVADGLPNNIVWSITEDKKGNLWIGMPGSGIAIFDGVRFTNLTTANGLANNSVMAIAEDRKGVMWFATDGGGVCSYNGRSFASYGVKQGVADKSILNVTEDRAGNLWFGCFNGNINRFDGKVFTTYKAEDGLAGYPIWCSTMDSAGNLWFGTYGGGVVCFNGSSFTTFTTAQGLANNNVVSLSEDADGHLWLGTEGGGISLYNGSAFTNFSKAQGLATNIIYSVAQDKSGNLWFGTNNDGVSCYNGRSFTSYSRFHGSTDATNGVRCIKEDKRGNLWFGTYGGGLCSFNYSIFTTYSSAQGLANRYILSLEEDTAGILWAGTEGGGVARYDGTSITNFSTRQGLAGNNVWDILKDRFQNLWFCTTEGVSFYNGRSFVNCSKAQGLAGNCVYGCVQDREGNMWFATDEGLSLLPSVETSKLIKLANSSTDTIKPLNFRNFTRNNGLPDNFVTQVVHLHDGRLAIGTNSGIAVFALSPNGNDLKDVKVYNSRNGYPVKDVNSGQHCMFVDSAGVIWAGTGNDKTSLVKFDPSALRKENGPLHVFIQNIKIDGRIICWHDLQNKPATDTTEKQVSATVAEEVTAYGRELSRNERDSLKKRFRTIQFSYISPFYPLPANLVLPHQHNNFTFEFVATDAAAGGRVNYQYILEGYDKDWSPVQKSMAATYGNMAEGSYTFKVRAQSPEGVWSAPAVYQFEVLPPWYRTWWAALVYLLIAGFILRVSGNWRNKKLKREKEKLEKTVEERTEELLQKNQLVEQQKADVELGKQRSDELVLQKDMLLREIHHRVKNNLQVIGALLELQSNSLSDGSAKDAIAESTLRVRSISLIHHQLYRDSHVAEIEISKFVADLFDQVASIFHHGSLQVKLNSDVKTHYFDIDTIVPFGLILNELFTNSFKYAFKGRQTGSISISIEEKSAHSFLMHYKDSGPGLPGNIVAEKAGSLGMRMIKRLSAQLGGKLIYAPETTTFSISFMDEIGRKQTD